MLVWGCMSDAGVGKLEFIDGIMTKGTCVDLLKRNLPQSVKKLSVKTNFTYYRDNGQKHKAHFKKM